MVKSTEKQLGIYRTVIILISAIVLLFRLWILKYTVELKDNNCACALEPRLLFIQVAIVASIIIMFIKPFYNINLLKVLGAMISLSYVVVGIWYIRDLKANKCACSEHLARTILEYVLYFYAAVYLFLFALVLIFGSYTFTKVATRVGSK